MLHSRRTPPGALTLLAVAFAFAFVAQAADAPASGAAGGKPEKAPASQAGPNAAGSKLICEQVEQMGSHFKRKVCATAEAWEARRRKDADQMQRMGDQGAGCGGVANPC